MSLDDYHAELIGHLAAVEGVIKLHWFATRKLAERAMATGKAPGDLTLREIQVARSQASGCQQ